MVTFTKGVPITVVQPSVSVDNTGPSTLPIGSHRFRLVVTDDAGNQSDGAFVDIIITDAGRPTAVIDVLDERGNRVVDFKISSGKTFALSGGRSTDVGGQVVSYSWTLM
jgi:hypothetical protein